MCTRLHARVGPSWTERVVVHVHVQHFKFQFPTSLRVQRCNLTILNRMVHSFIRRYSTRYTRTSFTSIDPCVTLVYRYLRRYFRKYDTIVLPYLFPFFKTTCTIVYSCTFEGTQLHTVLCVVRKYESTFEGTFVLSKVRKYFRTIIVLPEVRVLPLLYVVHVQYVSIFGEIYNRLCKR